VAAAREIISRGDPYQVFGRIIVGSSWLALGGCSSIAVTHPLAPQDRHPITLNYCIESTAEMNIINKSLTGEQNKARFQERIGSAINDVDSYIESHIVTSPQLQLNKQATCGELSPSTNSEYDLQLVVNLSGYGSIKPRWKNILIGTGAVEALAQGIIVGSVTQNPWFGIAASTEEMTSEYLTWNGVDWLLGETYAPVTLEGELTYPKNNKAIWANSYFVAENDDELAKLGAKGKSDKSLQLKASLHEAEGKLLSALNSYMTKQIL
jgi:hypothetical protein